MNRNRIVFFVALVVFVASFFVPAVHTTNFFRFDASGYQCALSTFFSPWSNDDSMKDLSRNPVGYWTFILSGIINPLFLAALVLLHTRRRHQIGKLLRTLVIGLFPACWILFGQGEVHPSVGYFLWTAAMLVALFTVSPKGQADPVQPNNIEPEKPKEASASTTFMLLEAAEGTIAS